MTSVFYSTALIKNFLLGFIQDAIAENMTGRKKEDSIVIHKAVF